MQLYCAFLGAGYNAEMEGVCNCLKMEDPSLILDAGSLVDRTAVDHDRIEVDNRTRRHSSLGDGLPSVIIYDRYQEG